MTDTFIKMEPLNIDAHTQGDQHKKMKTNQNHGCICQEIPNISKNVQKRGER